MLAVTTRLEEGKDDITGLLTPQCRDLTDTSVMYAEHLISRDRPGPAEVQISRALEKAIRRSEVVDRESLCILAGQKVRNTRL